MVRGFPQGAVFGFATYGTNPDLLLVLEVLPDKNGQQVWQFAVVRMTTGGLNLRHHDETVWTADWIRPVPEPRDTWMFFFVPQTQE